LTQTLDNFVYKIGLSSKLGSDTNIYYVNVPEPKMHSTRKNGTRSRANTEEALVISDLSQKINNNFVVLTPYKEQVMEIKHNAPELAHNGQLMTIHKSQGSEWETVIISIADTTNMWFTNTQNRRTRALELINTAVSRARNELIIVCDYAYWMNQKSQLITELLKCAKIWE
jgi:superfamily I DNA/RNA helicase